MSPRPRRTAIPLNLPEAIKATAWRQIVQAGAAMLSLRAIAGELGITAPAIYNYYPDRDALVTALIIEAYTAFGSAQLAAREALPASDLVGRLRAIGLAYRQWALAYPQHYQLIFGTPIPGYVAPVAQVFPVAARALSALVSVVEALHTAGRLNAPDFPEVHLDYKLSFEAWQIHGGQAHRVSLAVAMLIWARVHGLVSLEIAGNLPPFGPDGAALYHYELRAIEQQFVRGDSGSREI